MNIHRVLLFCFFSALCGGNTRLVSAKVSIYTAAEGGTASITCYHSQSGSRKFFCKNKCEAEDILIETDGNTDRSGRYSIKYTNSSSGGVLTMTFTKLTKSDSGRYRCGLGKTLFPDSYCEFDIRVSDAPLQNGYSGFITTETEGENITFGCYNIVYGKQKFLCRDECEKEDDILIETDDNRAHSGRYSIEYRSAGKKRLDVTITQVTKSDTGRYRCGYGRALSPDSYDTKRIVVIDAPTTFQPFPASASTPTTTQSLSSSSGFPSSVSTETTDQFTASSSTPTTTQSLSSSSGFPSSVSTETTDQFTAPTTFQPFPASASTPTPTQSLSSSSGFPSSVSTETTDQFTGYFWLLVVGVPFAFVLLAVFLLLLYKWKKRRNLGLNTRGNADDMFMEASVIYDNIAPVSTCEDPVYQSLDPASRDQDQIYSTLGK